MTPRISFRAKLQGPSSSQCERAMVDAYRQGLTAFGKELERVWRDKASSELNSTFAAYMSGLSVRVSNDGVEATLSGWLPVALEAGAKRFDMKPGLLRKRQSRVIPMHDGDFRTVSVRSPASSWWHPGFEARNIHEDVFDQTDKILQRTLAPVFNRVKV